MTEPESQLPMETAENANASEPTSDKNGGATVKESESENNETPAMETENQPSSATEGNPNVIDVSPDKDGGILKEIKREGVGEEKPSKGDKVKVHYVGTLVDGTKFDSSRDRGDFFEFNLGKGSVIKAWDVGVATMKKGELAVLTCKPEYAYGESGSPPKIPADSTLIFEVELFDWKGEDLSPDKDEGILRSQLETGQGFAMPNEGATVQVHIVGKYSGKVFEDRDVEFVVGESAGAGIVEGVDIAIRKFKKGEKAVLRLKPKYAFGSEGKQDFNVPGDATVEYTIHLKGFEKVKESWEMDSNEKLEQSEMNKTKGTNFFKAGTYEKAIKYYQKIVDFLEHESSLEGEDKEKRSSLMLAAHLNMAMCYLKLKDYFNTTKQCDKALEMDPKSEKGLFRRGQANLNLQEFDQARRDFEACLAIDPNNKAAKNQISVTAQKLKQYKQKQKQIYAGMFQKFAAQDAKHESPREKEKGEGDGKAEQVKEQNSDQEMGSGEEENSDKKSEERNGETVAA